MALFIDPERQEPYVPREEREKPEGERVTFHLRVLPVREYELRKDLVRGNDPQGFFKMGTWTLATLRHGLVGVEGPGVPEFEKDANGLVSESFLSKLHPILRDELAGAIDKLNRIGPEDRFE
jgi:hypothetical protein